LENPFRIVSGLLLAALALSSHPVAAADPIEGETRVVCGEWRLRLADFGKQKIRDYNAYVPENFQSTPGRLQPSVTISFPTNESFDLTAEYPDQLGETVTQNAAPAGTYKQKGKKLKFSPNAAGVVLLEAIFADLSSNVLFGDRARVADVPFVELGKLKFKGRIKKNNRLKLKLNSRLKYDIQYLNNSEYADRFDTPGVLKLRADTKQCDD
jgi:hypothetical protein